MTGRRLTTGVTLVALVVVLCIMAVWGYNAATAPVKDDSTEASAGPDCPPEDQIVTKYLHRSEVTVSVYNAGKRKGLAQSTMEKLESAGFKPGEVNNAAEGIDVERAAVYTTSADDPDAELVALALGKSTQVVRSDEEFGPGVDVVIGDKFKRLNPKASKRLELKEPERTCDPES
jgi:hypothetical protein